MTFRVIIGLLTLMIYCSCSQQNSKKESEQQQTVTKEQVSKSGLLFDVKRYRGTDYKDSIGTNYNLRYRPIIITNDTTISIHLQFEFLKEYDYRDEKFRILPLPREWGINGGNWDTMWNEFPKYLNNPVMKKTVNPGEEIIMAIAELLPNPPQFSINIDELFTINIDEQFSRTCQWLSNEAPLLNSEITLGLKLNFSGNCAIIPCGQISYPKH